MADALNTLQPLTQEVMRLSEKTHLMVVSKTQPAEAIEPLLRAGHRLFGENRVQEAQNKWPDLKVRYPDCVLHLIGPLQTNKVREALGLFDVIQTLDRKKLAHTLHRELEKTPRTVQFFIQVNTGAEPQKSGVLPDEADAFITLCRATLHLPVIGLMAIPPLDADPAPHFTYLADLARKHNLTELSMGMSKDYRQAIACGSTLIRLGQRVFGARGDQA